ncbi:MAG: hypothetical protein ACI8X3_002839 [Saprospiraceae bacterium]|jgi:uncharacterized protein (TIGR01777 family)
MSTILIGGGSGLIGTRLSEMLTKKGHKVLHLSRRQDLDAKFPKYAWDLKKGTIDLTAVSMADYIINLAGAGIADKRWTEARKKEIIESRTGSTFLIKKAVEQLKQTPKAIISASAIGFYGDRADELLKEDSKPGASGFLSESTQIWESAIHKLETLPCRQVTIRIGVVLSTKGGALKPFLLQNQFRLGTYFGNGQQYYSSIHIDDLCRIFIYAIENEQLSGVFNGVSPDPVTVYDFVKAVSAALNKKAFMIPAPSFAVRLLMGEMADVVLSSTRVCSKKIETQGFQFKYPTTVAAIRQLLKEKR